MLDENGNPIEEDKTTTDPTDESKPEDKGDVTPEKKEDKPKLSDTEAKQLKEIMALKAKAREAEAAKKALEEKFKDVDLEEIQKMLKDREEAETKELEKKGEYDRLLAKQREAAEKEKNELAEKLKQAEERANALIRTTEELAIGNAFANSKFVAEKLALTPNKTRALYGSHFEVKEGKLVAYDKPAGAADRTPIVDASGEGVSFEAAIEAIINSDPEKDSLIKSEQKPGAGSKGTTIDPTKVNTGQKSSLDKIAEGLKTLKVEN